MKQIRLRAEKFDPTLRFKVVKPMLYLGVQYKIGDCFKTGGVPPTRLRQLYERRTLEMVPEPQIKLVENVIPVKDEVPIKPRKRGRPKKIKTIIDNGS